MADHVIFTTPKKTTPLLISSRPSSPASSATVPASTPKNPQKRVLTGRVTKSFPKPSLPQTPPNIRANIEAKPTPKFPRLIASSSSSSSPAPAPKRPKTATTTSSSTPRTPGTPRAGKYGPCPQCHTGRRVRSRFKPHGVSPHAGKFRFVCSNRVAWDPESESFVGCPYWEVLEEDPKGRAEEFKRQGESLMGNGEGRLGEQKEEEVCPRCAEGRLVEAEKDLRRWWERVWLCEKRDGLEVGGCGYRRVTGVNGKVKGGSEAEGRAKEREERGGFKPVREREEFQGAALYDPWSDGSQVVDLTAEDEVSHSVPFKSQRTRPEKRRATTPAMPIKEKPNVVVIEDDEVPNTTDYGDFGSEDENELAQLADHVMDELGEQDELELIRMADKATAEPTSASISLPHHLDADEEEEDLELIELADRVSGCLPRQEEELDMTRKANQASTSFPNSQPDDEEDDDLELIELTDKVSASLPARRGH